MTNGEGKKNELVGGIKNALDRGENLEKAKQSLLNAGYEKEDVEAAAREFAQPSAAPTAAPQPKPSVPQPPGQPTPQKPVVPGKAEALKEAPQLPAEEKKMSKKLMIIMGIVAVLILAGAAILGLFWNKLF